MSFSPFTIMKTPVAGLYFVSSAKASGAIRGYHNFQELLIKQLLYINPQTWKYNTLRQSKTIILEQ